MDVPLIVDEVAVDENGDPCEPTDPRAVAIEVTWLDDTGAVRRTYLTT